MSGRYTCPMHPEIIRDVAGSCPICGMALEPLEVKLNDGPSAELVSMTRRFWGSAALTVPTFALAMSDVVLGRSLVAPPVASWLQLVLSTPVVLWGGWPFFQRGWQSLVSRRLNMFTLISIGTGAAWGFSVVVTLAPQLMPHQTGHGEMPQLYFEAAAVIVTLVLLGQVLELRARQATSGAIRALLGLAPKTARRLEADGTERDVPLEHIVADDRLRVRPSEKVPVDGVVLEGASTIDESMLTGESIPSEKGAGSPVTGGTLNGSGSFVMQARRVGKDTLLSQIVAMVNEAQRSRAPIERLVDVVSSWFVPIVLGVSVVTALVWGLIGPEPRVSFALINAVAVLIIACPCALGLATPMSIMVGAGRGAQVGVLFRDAEALETLRKVDTLVVDKTGTLTEGKPRLETIHVSAGVAEARALAVAAALELRSEHPLAKAILEGAKARGVPTLELTGFEAKVGRGVTGLIEGKRAALGNAALLGELGLTAGPLEAASEVLKSKGQTVVFVVEGPVVLGLLGVVDPIKPTTREALKDLEAAGVHVVMLTGDSKTTAAAVAKELGIADVHAEVQPAQKEAVVKALQASGKTVAMAGDGTNDAPALARAHVGIAMGTGTDVAMKSAGVTLVKGDLRGIVRARRLSMHVMRNIKQNLFFALAYNGLGVPIAAGVAYPLFGVLLSPMVASAAMALSSVSGPVTRRGPGAACCRSRCRPSSSSPPFSLNGLTDHGEILKGKGHGHGGARLSMNGSHADRQGATPVGRGKERAMTQSYRMTLLMLRLTVAGCATPGARPEDMSAAQHRRQADFESGTAEKHQGQYEATRTTRERCRGRIDAARVGVDFYDICWSSVTNPTESHLGEAEKYRRRAADHRAAAAALGETEERACSGVAPDDRDISPFEHHEDIAAVEPLTERVGTGKVPVPRTTGVVVTFRAVPGLTTEWLQRVVDCHLARNVSLGHEMPEMPNCPLVPKGAEARVSSTGNGFAVAIRSDDPISAAEILARATRLSHPPASTQ